MQLLIPDEKRGRVFSALNAIGTAAGLVSMALASFFGEILGLRNIYVLCGGIVISAAFLGYIMNKNPQRSIPEDLPGPTPL